MKQTDEREGTSRGKNKEWIGCVIVVVILAAVGAMLALGVGRSAPTTGTIQYEGGAQKPWKIDVDYCYTRQDIEPVGVAAGSFTSYASRLFTTKQADPHGLYVIRDGRASFGDDTVTIARGPNESPTKEDLAELAKYDKNKWAMQLKVPGTAPIRITPDMCKRFALDSTNETSRSWPVDRDGSVDLECTTPDGAKVTAKINYDGCP